ncbi:MAG: M3 family oligoendopeptidase [Nitratireductor sp.]
MRFQNGLFSTSLNGNVSASPAQPQQTGADSELGMLPEWNLTDLYPGTASQEFRTDLAKSHEDAAQFERDFKGKLASLLESDPEAVGQAIVRFEEIEQRMGRIMSYAGLLYAGNTTDPALAKFYGDAQEQITNAGSQLLFFGLELNRLETDAITTGMQRSATLRHYKPWLDDLRMDKPYQLEDRIELLFHEKSVTGHAAWNRLFDETMAGLRFTIDGKELTVEPALNLLQDRKRETREAAAREIGRVLGENSRVFTLITNTLAKDKEIADRWRGFADIADSRHLANRVEREVVDALVSAVRKAFPRISHRYYRMKAKWLGLEKMQHWDRNAPLPMSAEKVYSWDEARQTVLDAFGNFEPAMAEIANRFFERNWIDAPVRPGKSPGAFAHPTVPQVHPYVLVNYLGKPRDVMTLAHELGHGVHQILAGEQGALMAQTPLTLAETASVFGEMLTFRSLIDRAANPSERKAMLAQKVEDMINTVVRQIAFYQFERLVHEARREGELTSEQLGRMWLEVQKESLGDIFEFDDSYSDYWSYIPHFIHSPFYVYAYAFGDCLVNSLYAVYQDADAGFQERYFEMLKAGGTKHHSQLLKPFGLDAGDPGFWDKGLSVIEGLIDELEAAE